MSKAMQYVNFALGSTGFCILHSRVAYRLMPDNWCDAMDASFDLNNKTLPAKLNSVQGCQSYLARFAEFESGLVKVLARADDDLARRIKQITGFTTTQLFLASELEGQLDPADIPPRRVSAPIENDDLFANSVTKEGPRRCTDCKFAPDGQGCGNFGESRLMTPQMSLPRRCKGFVPRYGSYDDKNAVQLWPEIFVKV